MSLHLEEGGRGTSEGAVEDLQHSESQSPVLSIPTPVTPYGPTPPSPLSDFVWRSPELSSQPLTPYGPTPPSPLSDLVWSSPTLMKMPLSVCLLNQPVPFASHSTWLHFGFVEKRQMQEIFLVLLEMWRIYLASSYTVLVWCV